MSLAELDDAVEAVRALGRVDFAALPSAERVAAVERFEVLRSMLAATEAAAVGAFDAGCDWVSAGDRSAVVALRRRRRMYGPEAAATVRLARRLREMPGTQAALGAGTITIQHARRMMKAAGRPEFDTAEEFLLGKAQQLSFKDWERAVCYWESIVDENRVGDGPDAPDQRETARGLHLSKTMEGMGRLDGWLDPAGYSDFGEVLRRIEAELFDADWALAKQQHGDNLRLDDLWRSPSQRRADALVEMARRAVTADRNGKRARPLTIVHTDLATFEAALTRLVRGAHTPVDPLSDRVCELDDGTMLTPAQMIEQAIVGDVCRLVYTAPGVILDYGRKVRLFTGALREAICARDRTCAHRDCEIPARHCEIDHQYAWASGGSTSHTNAKSRCSFHHRRWKPCPG